MTHTTNTTTFCAHSLIRACTKFYYFLFDSLKILYIREVTDVKCLIFYFNIIINSRKLDCDEIGKKAEEFPFRRNYGKYKNRNKN